MRLKLKENPREWQKFTLAMMTAFCLAGYLLYRRTVISLPSFWLIVSLALVTVGVCGFVPRWFRPIYRLGMTLSFRVGQVMGRILLTVVFFLVLTPLGLLMRLFGKDLLGTHNPAPTDSYWQAARPNSSFERPF
jgi:hypothetical protein